MTISDVGVERVLYAVVHGEHPHSKWNSYFKPQHISLNFLAALDPSSL